MFGGKLKRVNRAQDLVEVAAGGHRIAQLQLDLLSGPITNTVCTAPLSLAVPRADFHDLSPRDFYYHSPTPGFCFSRLYQFFSFMAITTSSFVGERGAPAPHRRTEGQHHQDKQDSKRGGGDGKEIDRDQPVAASNRPQHSLDRSPAAS